MGRLYTYYALSIAFCLFILNFPLQFLFLQSEKTYKWANALNHINIRICFFLTGFKISIRGREKLDRNENYIYVANHFSLLDIPMMFYVVKGYGVFVGKDSLEKIPLFGYMYKRLYITVNRRDAQSRNMVFEEGLKLLRHNHNIIIFPEGTISLKAPEMISFKDGAFKLAQMSGKKIVPVTILNNWKILPDTKPLKLKNYKFAAIIHDPVSISGDGVDEIHEAKSEVFNTIQKEVM